MSASGSSALPPPAYVILDSGRPAEEAVPVPLRLVIGREPTSADPAQQLRLQDPSVSRHHAEIRLDLGRGAAVIVDTSTNGTWLNGVRIERAVPIPLEDGDVVGIGSSQLLFRSNMPRPAAGETEAQDHRETVLRLAATTMALVVGDVVGYSTIAQVTPGVVLVQAMDRLFGALRIKLRARRGTLADMPGDAFFAFWDLGARAGVTEDAVAFALEAATTVVQLAPTLGLQAPDGTPVAMGWATVVGEVAVSPLGASILGDATNLAFRLSGVAGREGRPTVLATAAVRDLLAPAGTFVFGSPFEVTVKGRVGAEVVCGVTAP